jgi:cyclic pyranopterin phosphate synthase
MRPSITYLRIAVTARCNLRCVYCQPACGAEGSDLLTAGEIGNVLRQAVACGIRKVRITGGEPLLRQDMVRIVREAACIPGLDDLSLTTNGTLLPPLAAPLWDAGLRRINIGLSAVNPDVYQQVTTVGSLDDALDGLHTALEVGFQPVKVNVVVMRGINDGQIVHLARLTRDQSIEVRFIEYMPFAEEREKRQELLVPADEVIERIRELGEPEPVPDHRGPASAQRFRIPGYAGVIGVIAPHSAPFCGACNRIRLTAEGRLRACLIDGGELDLLPQIRAGLTREGMRRILDRTAALKPARHSGQFCGQMHRIGG